MHQSLNPLNPFTVQIEGDLSRADTVVLTQLCRGKHVVEFGVGGSTLLFAQIAKSVISFDTSEEWIQRVTDRLLELPDKSCEPAMFCIEKTRDGSAAHGLSTTCDVLFDDGWSMLRAPFLLEFWQDIRECAILHDTRLTYAGNILKVFIDAYDPKADKEPYPCGFNPYLGTLQSIEWNYLESNMAVLRKRNCFLSWENWKINERGNNRAGWGK